MLPIHAQLTRRAAESSARSALPDAPRVPVVEAAPAAAARRALAGRLRGLADLISPEPVERSRWQSG